MVKSGIWTGGVKVFSFLAKKIPFIKAKDQCFFGGLQMSKIYIYKKVIKI
jgi:hypothetical protein